MWVKISPQGDGVKTLPLSILEAGEIWWTVKWRRMGLGSICDGVAVGISIGQSHEAAL
jgi:hypothetical protein